MRPQERHPVLSHAGLVFKVPPLVEFMEEFLNLLNRGELSMVCYAPPRFGKSTARRYIQTALSSSKSMVVVTAIIERDVHNKDSRSRLWRDLLRGKDMAANLLSTSPYDTLFNKLVVEADMLQTDSVLVLLDEAQNLSVEKLAALKKLIDELIDHGLSPFVLLIAQPEIMLRSRRLRECNLADLVDRFFTQVYRFRGVSLKEFPEVLGMYDSTDWPLKSGESYTAYFLPEAWKQTWKLKNQSSTFESAFMALHKSLGIKSEEVGMKYLVTAVRNFLLAIQADGVPTPTKVAELVQQCVARSGLVQAYQRVGNVEEQVTLASVKKLPRLKVADA